VELEVGGPADAVAAALRGVPGVLRVETLGPPTGASRDGTVAFAVESARDRDLREDLGRLVLGKGWRLLELHQVGMSLEDVFIRVVAGEEHAAEHADEPMAAGGA